MLSNNEEYVPSEMAVNYVSELCELMLRIPLLSEGDKMHVIEVLANCSHYIRSNIKEDYIVIQLSKN